MTKALLMVIDKLIILQTKIKMESTHDKASQKLFEIIKEIDNANLNDWKSEKELIRYIIQQHINQSYMVDVRYYKDYTNFWHEVLIILNEL